MNKGTKLYLQLIEVAIMFFSDLQQPKMSAYILCVIPLNTVGHVVRVKPAPRSGLKMSDMIGGYFSNHQSYI